MISVEDSPTSQVSRRVDEQCSLRPVDSVSSSQPSSSSSSAHQTTISQSSPTVTHCNSLTSVPTLVVKSQTKNYLSTSCTSSSSSSYVHSTHPQSLLAAALSPSPSALPSCSYQQTSNQFEHVTVMSHLQNPATSSPEMRTKSTTRSNSTSGQSNFGSVTSINSSGLQIHQPSAITQQVQLSVPAIAGGSFSTHSSQPSRSSVGGRYQNYRSTGTRTNKTSLSAMLPIMGRTTAKQFAASMAMIGDDGPTVRQHLQQQQQKARLQQQLAMQAKQKAESDGTRENSEKNNLAMPVSKTKFPARSSHVQRPYVPRLTTVQRQKAVAEAAKQQYDTQTVNGAATGATIPPSSICLNSSKASKGRKQISDSAVISDQVHYVRQTSPALIQTSGSCPPQQQFRPQTLVQTIPRGHGMVGIRTVTPSGQSSAPNIQRIVVQQQTNGHSASQVCSSGLQSIHSSAQMYDGGNGTGVLPKRPTNRKRFRTPRAPQVRVTVFSQPPSLPSVSSMNRKVSHTSQLNSSKPDVMIIGVKNEVASNDVQTHIASDGMGSVSRFTQPTASHSLPSGSVTFSAEQTVSSDVSSESMSGLKSNFPSSVEQSVVIASSGPPSVVTERHGSSVVVTHQKTLVPVAPGNAFLRPQNVHSNGAQVPGSGSAMRQKLARIQHLVRQKQENQMYQRKMYFLKRTIKSLVFKNGALCDEVARLNQRIQTVTEERKVLAKRLQHFERNRIRRIQTKMKKEAALAAKMSAYQLSSSPAALTTDPEPEEAPIDVTENEEIDSEKTASSCDTPSPATSASASRMATPEPSIHSGPSSPLSGYIRATKRTKFSASSKSRKIEKPPTRASISRKVKRVISN